MYTPKNGRKLLEYIKTNRITDSLVKLFADELNSPFEFLVFINSLEDLEASSHGIFTFGRNKTYIFNKSIDLKGGRIVTNGVCNIFGNSSETSKITSTGLPVGVPLITSTWTVVLESITIENVDTALDINGNTRLVALDWENVNFENVPNIGVINTCDNFIFDTGAFLGAENLVFTGTIGTVALNNSLFRGLGNSANIIEVDANAIITRRFRVNLSSIISISNNIGLNFNVAASVPVNSYILSTVNFSGSGTYISGVDFSDNKALFDKNVGITNSREISQYSMVGNVTPTTIAIQGTPYKILGTTVSGNLTSKFTNTDNRATYIGTINKIFVVNATLSVESGNNNQIGIYIAKNGTVITESEIYITTNASGRAESANVQAVLVLETDDYVEIFVENESSLTSVVVTELNVIIR